jgi:hypothetical protein
VAEQLAAQSDAVADAIAANDGCLAEQRVGELRATLASSEVPEAVRSEVERVADREFTCNPPPPPPPPPVVVPTETEEEDDEEGGGEKKKDKKDKKDKQHCHEGGDD